MPWSYKNPYCYNVRYTVECVLLMMQNPDVWALSGHVKYLIGDTPAAKECYERTTAFVSDASEMHSIYLRLASIYLQEEQVCKSSK